MVTLSSKFEQNQPQIIRTSQSFISDCSFGDSDHSDYADYMCHHSKSSAGYVLYPEMCVGSGCHPRKEIYHVGYGGDPRKEIYHVGYGGDPRKEKIYHVGFGGDPRKEKIYHVH
jgi:hypothetical protein